MIRIELNCDCCELYVIPAPRASKAITYILNGERYKGQTALGKACGLFQTSVARRVERRDCLRIGKGKLPRNFVNKPQERDERPSQLLASRFVTVMARSFYGRGRDAQVL